MKPRHARLVLVTRGGALLAPVATARLAVIYQRFVDGIEPVERRHHEADVIDNLRATVRSLEH